MTLIRLRALAVACLAVAAAPTSASNFLASNGLVVEPRGADFVVPYRGESGASAFWCAAAEYAEIKLRQSPATVLYRTSEPPRRSGEGIAFSLSPSQSASATGLLVIGAKGGGLTIAGARNLCNADRLLRR